MNNRRKINKPTTLLLVLAAVSMSIIFFTLYAYYKSSLIHFSGTLDKDYFPAFGSFISGTVGLILSIASVILIYSTYQTQQKQLEVTRGLVDRQISLSIKPELVVEDYDSRTFVSKPRPIPTNNSKDNDELLPEALQKVALRMLNIGIEAAQNIQYSFDYDVVALLAYMDSYLEKPILSFEYITDQDWMKITHIESQKAEGVSVKDEQKRFSKDYLMPYKLNSDFIQTDFPTTYLLCYYFTVMAKVRRMVGESVPLETFPQCYLNASYRDLEGKTHTKRFDIKLTALGFSLSVKAGRVAERQLLIKFTSHEVN